MTIDIDKLSAPFPADKVSWRVGSTTGDKAKGMALAYIDARDVMDRLDEVCGPENWQCKYPHATNKTCCEIAIKFDDEWVSKSNGAGDTDVEGDKGAFSDAFKRAAVLWGVGRYLYDLGNTWVEIEQRGRSYTIKPSEFAKLKATLPKQDNALKNHGQATGPLGIHELKTKLRTFCGDLPACDESDMLTPLLESYKPVLAQCERDLPGWWHTKEGADNEGIKDRIKNQKRIVEKKEAA